MFCDPEYVKTEEYTKLWKKLASGSHEVGEFNRFTKDGKEIWINASYNPVLNSEGKPKKVVKFATDITASKLNAADSNGKLEAISKSMAMIEFDLKGNILYANENFLCNNRLHLRRD